jgi:hypothetical protein
LQDAYVVLEVRRLSSDSFSARSGSPGKLSRACKAYIIALG